MDKFRVISDLHIDINENYPIELPDDDVFTVICGDTSGDPKLTIDWINANVKRGVFISGNHLPYCNHHAIYGEKQQNVRLMSELRQELANAFQPSDNVTYLDVETGAFTKVVDGILFIGTTMYTDMMISHQLWNKTGDPELNKRCSEYNMNDYIHGYISRQHPVGIDNEPAFTKMRASDYQDWFMHAFGEIDKVLSDNEQSSTPLPVVLITHHSLIKDFCMHSYYVDNAQYLWRQREFNWASYASDREDWLKQHHSIKCYCCGHIHSPEKDFRSFKIKRDDDSEMLVVNNTRGYVRNRDDFDFDMNRFVDTRTWSLKNTSDDK